MTEDQKIPWKRIAVEAAAIAATNRYCRTLSVNIFVYHALCGIYRSARR
jgi:hypothetical protein